VATDSERGFVDRKLIYYHTFVYKNDACH
jgi:hypothetical protein